MKSSELFETLPASARLYSEAHDAMQAALQTAVMVIPEEVQNDLDGDIQKAWTVGFSRYYKDGQIIPPTPLDLRNVGINRVRLTGISYEHYKSDNETTPATADSHDFVVLELDDVYGKSEKNDYTTRDERFRIVLGREIQPVIMEVNEEIGWPPLGGLEVSFQDSYHQHKLSEEESQSVLDLLQAAPKIPDRVL